MVMDVIVIDIIIVLIYQEFVEVMKRLIVD
jgi:hypothetical protein